MMRSMFSGVSGLKVHQTRMDVIGNNIANVNTTGYKSQRVTFTDVFSQTLSSASSASDDTGRGGLNPMQVGLGVNISSIDILMTQGAAQRTDNPFDLMINGDGFIVVADAEGQYFTRAGALRTDVDGNLFIANGMMVQGWQAQVNDAGKYEIVKGQVSNINLGSADLLSSSPTATTLAEIAGNIDATETEVETSIKFYDSLGNYYTAVINLTKNGNTWEATLGNVTDVDGNRLTDPAPGIVGSLEFDSNGRLVDGNESFILTFNGSETDAQENADGSISYSPITIDVANVTQYATKSTIKPTSNVNGNSSGTMSGYDVGTDGIIRAYYSNGDMRVVAQVVLAQFDNPEGLEKVGDNLYKVTANSGEFDGIGEAGNFNAGVLEMSNVDLATEFTDMIITQRGFQANSRIISVSDEMLQELTNLKR